MIASLATPGWIDLLVQEACSLDAALEWARGLDGGVELGRDGVCEKVKRVRRSGYFDCLWCY